jgi:hypothetical protein
MKTFSTILKIIAIGAVIAIGMTVLQTGCASAPPTAFETAESLEGTAWVQGSILAMKDKTSGVFTDREDKETAFTYTAVYDANARTFSGTINLEDGRKADYSAKKVTLFGWTLTAKVLEQGGFQYNTPEQLEEVYKQKRVKAEIVEKYGSEYLGLNNKELKREGEEFYLAYNSNYGLHQPTRAAMGVVRTGYKLHSTDGVSMTMLSINTTTWQYAGVAGVGTFNIRVSGNTVTISNGTGAGAAFNGTYSMTNS